MGSLMLALVQDLPTLDLLEPQSHIKLFGHSNASSILSHGRTYKISNARILHHRRTCAHGTHITHLYHLLTVQLLRVLGSRTTSTNVYPRALHYHCLQRPPVTPSPSSSPSITGSPSRAPIRQRLSGCATADASSPSSCGTTHPQPSHLRSSSRLYERSRVRCGRPG